MRRKIIKLLNRALSTRGYSVFPLYFVDHMEFKNKEYIKEIINYFEKKENVSFDPNQKRLDLISKLYGTSIIESLYLIKYLKKCLNLSGDVCEFGTANGATAALLANEIKKTNKKLWLYDSFMGLSKPTIEDNLIDDIFNLKEMNKYEGSMSYSKSEVLERLRQIGFSKKRIKIIAGFIEDTSTIKSNLPSKISFAYIDFDLYKPIITALNAIHPFAVKGAVIIVDDYDFFSSGVKKAVKEFLKKHKYDIVSPGYSGGNFRILIKK